MKLGSTTVPAEKDFDPLLESREFGDEDGIEPEIPAFHRLHASYAVVVLVLVVTGLPIQFPDLRSASAGGPFHLRPMVICMQPGQFDRDTRVEVARS